MKSNTLENKFFGTEKIWKILLRLAPPVMFAQLIQSMYNIVDSYFVGAYSSAGLTALSIIYPLQLLIMAFGIGTGIGLNTLMARFYGQGNDKKAKEAAGTGTILALISWAVFALIFYIIMVPFVEISAESQEAAREAIIYGRIVCVGSLGLFMESTWTKIHQARGNMKRPMIAQVAGALTNIVLDPVFIWGFAFIPPMGIAGAAIATVLGQMVAAAITCVNAIHRPPTVKKMLIYIKRIYQTGLPSIVMQAMYTVYIIGLNLILVSFSDSAVTVLGLYYKLQAFFFIPLFGLQTCIVPILSYNYAIDRTDRCKGIIWQSNIISAVFMILGIASFEFIPAQLLGIFTNDTQVISSGVIALRIIAISFIPAVLSLMFPVFFQAIGKAVPSIALTLLRQLVLLVPLAFFFSFMGLNYVWLTFPITEIITGVLAIYLYIRQCRLWKEEKI